MNTLDWVDLAILLGFAFCLGIGVGYRTYRWLIREATLDWPELLKLQVPTVRHYIDLLEDQVDTLERNEESLEERAANWKSAAKGYRAGALAWKATADLRKERWLTDMTDAEVRALDMIVSDGCSFLGRDFQELREQMITERLEARAARPRAPELAGG